MALSIFQSLFNKGYIGVDIGTTSIKAVEAVRDKKGIHLRNYGALESFGHLKRIGGAIQTSSMQLVDTETIQLLSMLLSRMRPATKLAVASVPNFLGFMTLIDLPQMDEKELGKAVGFQAREHVPLPIDEVLLDWVKVGTSDEGGLVKEQVLLIAIPTKIVENYRVIFDRVGLKLMAIELDSVALARATVYNDPTPTVIADIGSRATTISIVNKGALRMTFNSQTAGSDLSQAITKSLRVSPRRAEELKRARGLVTRAGEEELSTLMIPLLDAIVSEIKRSIEIYQKKYSAKIERVMLSGGTANLPNIESYFGSQLDLPTVSVAPLSRFTNSPGIEPLIPELNPLLAVATGLAIRSYV